MPPPAEGLAPRLFLGPALRSQSDRRLVRLVREGYETAFEEIVRRYGAPLRRYAAAIVGGDAEDVTQDSFAKALQALRRDDAEIELRPWLYRIVRNTALNDLRDRPRPAEELAEAIVGGRSAAEEAEQRQEVAELITRLRALPERQRAAIVMRELEGLGHEEIAAALGVSGGAARQAIHRARTALRDAVGLLVPLPFLRMLIDHGAEATAAAGAGGAAGVAAAGASVGGAGGGVALKAGLATALIAGSVGTGVALDRDRHEVDANASSAAASESQLSTGSVGGDGEGSSPSSGSGSGSGDRGRDDHGGSDDRGGSGRDDDDRGNRGPSTAGEDSGHGESENAGEDSSGPSTRSGSGQSGSGGDSSHSGTGSHSGPSANSGPGSGGVSGGEIEDNSGPGGGDDDPAGESSGGGAGSSSGPGSGEAQAPEDDSSGSGDSGSDGSGSSGSGSDDD